MAGAPSDYKHGEMNVDEQAGTYHAFLGISKWGSLALATGILFFVLLFCTKAGFIAALVSAVVLLVLGVLLLSEKKKTAAH